MVAEFPPKAANAARIQSGDAMLKIVGALLPGRGINAVLRRVSFQPVPVEKTTVFLSFLEPEARVAILEEVESNDWPMETVTLDGHALASPDFDCVCLHAGRTDASLLARAAEWIDPHGGHSATTSVLINVRGGWVRVKQGRAVICLPPEEWSGALTALADFFFHDFELRKLEREIATNWQRAEADLPLANDVKPEDLERLGDIGITTQSVWMRRIRLAKLERPLAKCQIPLPPIAKKLAARLRIKFSVNDRAETLDGQIEVYEYIYEMANQRMGEYGNFRREYLLEILIVFLLSAELIVMVLEYLKK